ncbi:hypothetical protein QQF21_17180 [Lelliottia sp. V89_10]|uniref:hypothetical protein n=1 Tax=Lelliottia wanjuensis TaxID=3050585 RepID=UPI00249DFC23|nr:MULTISPECIES: hypothetical protein [unclassified Lelliottia]MDI3359766.1 hypothetical protein [Lelliottia sp. V89_13]MDK9548724.1 hypothetical protein [Lelliottia sp. V89_5]MDK9597356.1 hypothetical protein [Lelliottia sp. V89_10]
MTTQLRARGDVMLTIRLNLKGVVGAFQTCAMVSLLKEGDAEFASLMSYIPAGLKPGIVDVKVGVPLNPNTVRHEQDGSPVALIKLDANRGEIGDKAGSVDYVDGCRLICLYQGDNAKVIDCGSILFGWPEKQ